MNGCHQSFKIWVIQKKWPHWKYLFNNEIQLTYRFNIELMDWQINKWRSFQDMLWFIVNMFFYLNERGVSFSADRNNKHGSFRWDTCEKKPYSSFICSSWVKKNKRDMLSCWHKEKMFLIPVHLCLYIESIYSRSHRLFLLQKQWSIRMNIQDITFSFWHFWRDLITFFFFVIEITLLISPFIFK